MNSPPINSNNLKLPIAKGRSSAFQGKLGPGTFSGKIEKVETAPGYEPGAAVQIIYLIQDGTQLFRHKEVFLNSQDFQRTADFIAYLENNGVVFDDWSELEGLSEELTFTKQIKKNRTFLNITARRFIGFNGGEAK